MAGEFADNELGQLLSFANGRTRPVCANGLPYPVYGSNGIIGYTSETNAPANTIIIGRVGSYCGSLYLSKQPCWVTDNAIRATALHVNDPIFLYYLLSTLRLNSWRAGSGHPLLNQDILSRIPAKVPEPGEQRAIAQILGTLDNKIELNRCMNETLEEIARTLFKSWFVDFDPVRAKAEGRDPGLPGHIAKLFPNAFEISELGEKPKGWSVVCIGDISQRISMGPFGSDIKTDNFIKSGVPVIRGMNLKSGFDDEEVVFISSQKADELRNANAFADDIVITHRGTLGQVGLIPKGSRYPRYVVSQSQMLISVARDKATPRYVYDFLRSKRGQHLLLANTSQTGVPAIARPTNSVKQIVLLLPPLGLLKLFDELVGPIHDRCRAAATETRSLAALRDILLPKLISGAIRVGGEY